MNRGWSYSTSVQHITSHSFSKQADKVLDFIRFVAVS